MAVIKRHFVQGTEQAGKNIADTDNENSNTHSAGPCDMFYPEQVRSTFSKQLGVQPFPQWCDHRGHRIAIRQFYSDSSAINERSREEVDNCFSRVRLESLRRILIHYAKGTVPSGFYIISRQGNINKKAAVLYSTTKRVARIKSKYVPRYHGETSCVSATVTRRCSTGVHVVTRPTKDIGLNIVLLV